MYQQWLQIIGSISNGIGFGLIALEWYRGYREMRKKVDLVTRNMERAEKIRLRDHIKQAIGWRGSVKSRHTRRSKAHAFDLPPDTLTIGDTSLMVATCDFLPGKLAE